jgi:hypothetical protein
LKKYYFGHDQLPTKLKKNRKKRNHFEKNKEKNKIFLLSKSAFSISRTIFLGSAILKVRFSIAELSRSEDVQLQL